MFRHSPSRNSGGFLESFEGHISFDGDNIGDDDEEAVEVMAEGTVEAVEVQRRIVGDMKDSLIVKRGIQ